MEQSIKMLLGFKFTGFPSFICVQKKLKFKGILCCCCCLYSTISVHTVLYQDHNINQVHAPKRLHPDNNRQKEEWARAFDFHSTSLLCLKQSFAFISCNCLMTPPGWLLLQRSCCVAEWEMVTS